jgi:hypothetical protein
MRTGCWEPDEPDERGERGEQGEQGEHAKNATFTTYPQESKGLVNKVNVRAGYFDFSRTSHAKLRRLEGVSGAGSPACAGVAHDGVQAEPSAEIPSETGVPKKRVFRLLGWRSRGTSTRDRIPLGMSPWGSTTRCWDYPGSPASAGVAVTGVVRRGSRRRNPKTGAPQQSRFWIVGVEDVGITSFLTSLVCLISTRSQSRSEINLRGSQRNFEISLRSRPVSPLDFEITLF